MKRKSIRMIALLLSLAIGITSASGCDFNITTTGKDITPQEAYDLIQENHDNPDFVIMDVRTPEEFNEGHIAGATNIDFYSETFRDTLNGLDKNKTYLVYCRVGNRSGNTMKILSELQFKDSYNMLGGNSPVEGRKPPYDEMMAS